jgi:hypothetical protein
MEMKKLKTQTSKGHKAVKAGHKLDTAIDKNFSGKKAIGGPNPHKSGSLEVKVPHTGKMRSRKRVAKKS